MSSESNKRKAFSLNAVTKKVRADAEASRPPTSAAAAPKNPFLKNPVVPERALSIFLTQARNSARRYLPAETKLPVSRPFCEIEARFGILKSPVGLRDRRVASSGPKHVGGGTDSHHHQVAHAFHIDNGIMESGITRSHYVHWTQAGLSQVSPISLAFDVKDESTIKRRLITEKEYVETVYAGYSQDKRVVFEGMHPPTTTTKRQQHNDVGKMEHKEKLTTMDLCIPAANYDLRIALTTEKALDPHVPNEPPPGWTVKRVKRRRSYTRKDYAWQLDVTEVTTSHVDRTKPAHVSFEIEMELKGHVALQLINEESEERLKKLTSQISGQLWFMSKHLNTMSNVMDAEDFLRDHPDKDAVKLAQATCGALKRFMDHATGSGGGAGTFSSYKCPIGDDEPPSASLCNVKFIGCMPVNFSRHNIEDVQRSEENGYFLSEKTDGVRYLLVFTGTTAVLIDRKMRGKQPIPRPGSNPNEDPFAPVLPLIQPGTVLDGEVVMHRRARRPVFIVFDVLALSTTQPILQLPFEQRLHHLKRASFRTTTANRDMFDEAYVRDMTMALPLVRKNFVKRLELDNLLSKVVEQGGTRTYCNGDVHNHLTDGIIFQPNLPYKCGTDVNLLKWKYLDTVTIDVELLPPRHSHNHSDDDDKLRVGVLGEEQTMVDMTRFVNLPQSELRRLEADREETGSRVAEVGFDPTTGEWYYLTMRPDKDAPNHISTVLGTLLELAESLTTEELRYRMSVPVGARDTYRKDVRGMQRQLLDHQRKQNQALAAAAVSSSHHRSSR